MAWSIVQNYQVKIVSKKKQSLLDILLGKITLIEIE